ncbi:MAG: hypothetical protein ONB27_14660 [candidate division KSB1 bacterium]|nr:hypothetical protein [candidate division KSB1 bacterium]
MIMKQGDLIDLNEVVPLLETKEPPAIAAQHELRPLQQAREDFEREYILRVLDESDWKIAKAAEVLHINRANLYRKMRGLGITVH